MENISINYDKIFGGILGEDKREKIRLAKERENNEVLRELWSKNKFLFFKQALGYEERPFLREGLEFKGVNIPGHPQKNIAVWLAPRGCGKSTIGTIADTIWRICQDRNITHLIASETMNTSILLASSIKRHLEKNEKLIKVYGSFIGKEKWNESFFIVDGRTGQGLTNKEGTVECIGVKGASTGRHCDIIICDDLVSYQNSRTPAERRLIEEWFNVTLLPMLKEGKEEKGQILIRGTKYFYDDLYKHLEDFYGPSAFIVHKALIKNEDGSYKSIDNNLYPVEWCLNLMRTNPAIFYSQYQNEIRIVKGSTFAQYIRTIENVPENWSGFEVWIGLDLSTGRAEDNSALTMALVDGENKIIYVPYSEFGKWTNTEKIAEEINKAVQYCYDRGAFPNGLIYESNGLAKLIMDDVLNILESKGVAISLLDLNKRQDKISFATYNSVFFTSGFIFILDELTDLIEELSVFPDSKNDDIVDSLMLALYCVRNYSEVNFYEISNVSLAIPQSMNEVLGVVLG